MMSLSTTSGGGSLSDDEDEADKKIFHHLVQKYDDGNGGQGEGDQQSFRDRLTESLRAGRHGCLVCLEPIGRPEPVWSCVQCYETYHLTCIQKWSLQAVELAELNEDEQIVWCCPKCRFEYARGDRPKHYYCFCGKQRDPESSPWVAPHSCDTICGRKLTGCAHTCRLLCHPGPCPPCPIVVSVSCYCDASPTVGRRCGTRGWTCQKECNKQLTCGRHKCKQLCHAGECAECSLTSTRSCQCGANRRQLPCAHGQWQCDTVCGKTLDCGQHRCTLVCHSGSCPSCVRVGQDSCPCGAQQYIGVHKCVDELPCCGGTCNKLLACEKHNCYQQCHKGDCPRCTELVSRSCRCGAKKSVKAQCGDKMVTCEVKCRQMRHCGRHTCNRKCCDGRCPPCEQTCGRQLNCGNHKCAAPCHRGQCYPCTETQTLRCPCGASSVRVPCHAVRRTKPPKCSAPCLRPPDCHHPARQTHKCHSGDCPPCTQICGIKMANCEHNCQMPCHSAVMVDVNKLDGSGDTSALNQKTNKNNKKPTTNAKPVGFWDRPSVDMQLRALPCPPCPQPVKIMCLGEHEQFTMECSQQTVRSCGQTCGHTLKCNNHQCSMMCHKRVDSNIHPSLPSTPCEDCHAMCSLLRVSGCTHQCPQQCHPPPCAPCKHGVKITCACGVNEVIMQCSKWTSSSADEQARLRTCGNQCPRLLSSCGHQCRKTCHTTEQGCSSQSECTKRVTLTCKCKRQTMKTVCSKVFTEQLSLTCDAECEALMKEKVDKEKEETQENETQSNNFDPTAIPLRRRNRKKQRSGDQTNKPQENELLVQLKAYALELVVFGVISVLAIGLWYLWNVYVLPADGGFEFD